MSAAISKLLKSLCWETPYFCSDLVPLPEACREIKASVEMASRADLEMEKDQYEISFTSAVGAMSEFRTTKIRLDYFDYIVTLVFRSKNLVDQLKNAADIHDLFPSIIESKNGDAVAYVIKHENYSTFEASIELLAKRGWIPEKLVELTKQEFPEIF